MGRAFLIGAGATKAQYKKAPLCEDFFKLLKGSDKREHYSHIQSTIQHVLGGKDLSEWNVEDVMLKSYDFEEGPRIDLLDSLYTAIYFLLAKSTKSTNQYWEDYTNDKTTDSPTQFRTYFNTGYIKKDDFFMTLNYDLYLDREIAYQYNKIDYGLSKGEYTISSISLINNPKFSVYHLHGALNWELVNDKTKIRIHKGAINPTYKQGSNVCLIPPGTKEPNSIIEKIWEKAKERLSEATELIIIGCSLNPDDTELNSLIQSFKKDRGAEHVKVIYKHDDDKKYIVDNYQDIFGEDLKMYQHGFNIQGKKNVKSAIHFIQN